MVDQALVLGGELLARTTEEESVKFVHGTKEMALCMTVATALQVVIVTSFFYYCALHISEEIEYIWFIKTKPWTYGKTLYLITRYIGAIFLVFVSVGIFAIGWNNAGSKLDRGKELQFLEKGECFGGYLYVVAGMVAFFMAEVISAWRVYALFERKKRIIAICAILILLSAAGMQMFGFIYTITPAQNCIGTPCKITQGQVPIPYQVVFPCSVASTVITSFGWVATMLAELVFLCMVLWKIRQSSKLRSDYKLVNEMRPYTQDVIGLMAHDSKKYFFWIFSICFVGTCMSVLKAIDNIVLHSTAYAILLVQAINNAYSTFAIAAVTIIAPRIILNLRIEHYGPVGSLVEKSQLSWRVTNPESSVDTISPQFEGSQGSQYSVIVDQELNEPH